MMKKCILFLLATFTVLGAWAQDLIVKTDSTRIEAIVAEISTENVRYKRFARPDGPTYVLPVAQICYIRYSDGFVEDYNRTKPQVAATPTTPESEAARIEEAKIEYPVVTTPEPKAEPTPAPTPKATPAAQPVAVQQADADHVMRFEVGQYYDYNGMQGIVFATYDDGAHGLIVSLDEVMIEWSTFRKEALCTVGTTDQHDGAKNMEIVADYIAKNNLTWDHFPAFKWCRDKGEGWYLPSIDELLRLGNNYNGGNRQHNNRQARTRFNDHLKEHGGDRIDGKCFYFSSTEFDAKFPASSHMGLEAPYVFNEIPKYSKFLVRAIHKF